MADIGNIFRQVQRMKAEMERLQEEAAAKRVEGSAGGGMVTVVCSGKGEVLSVHIDPQVVESGDQEMLQDLVVAATNEALRRARELATQEMGKLAGALGLPPGLV